MHVRHGIWVVGAMGAALGENRSFSHVVYLDGDCDNMFGWGNFLFWPQVHTITFTVFTTTMPQLFFVATSILNSFSSRLVQLRDNNGTLYGWDLTQRSLIFSSVGLGPGSIWGKGVGANQITSTLTPDTHHKHEH
jgi:hypothetical protein